MPDMSVLIATYNRAEVLRQTLEAMCALDRDGLDVKFVIIDNNSKDHTGEVIDSFQDRLPIQHLFQPRQGKSASLNMALDNLPECDLVVFTDDDVLPPTDWLKKVVSVCERNPGYSLFGGRIALLWPDEREIPAWARSGHESLFCIFSHVDLGCDEREFPAGNFPAGAHTWLRADLVRNHRFNEGMGPGDAGAHGEDLQYCKELVQAGHIAFYASSVELYHRVHPILFHKGEARKRVFKRARMTSIFGGLARPALFERAPRLWLVLRGLSVARHAVFKLLLSIPGSNDKCFLMSLEKSWLLGFNAEQLRMGWKLYQKQRVCREKEQRANECPK